MSGLPDIIECSGAVAGFAAAVTVNLVARKPAYSGFHKHIIFAAIGYGLGVAVSRSLNEVRRRRALHVEDYIRAHPEHFEELFKPEKKWRDVFEKWYPNR